MPSLSCIALLASVASALPATSDSLAAHHRRCGTVSQFYGQTPQDWQSYNTDQWLSTWMTNHSSDISSNSNGFSGAFGQWALGNPDWSCRDDGSASACDLDPCDNRVLNDKGNDIRQAYYVLESVNRLHTYFTGISQAFEVSSIATSLRKDSWSQTFYQTKDNSKAITALKEVMNAITTVIGIGAAFASLAGPVTGAVGGAISAAAGGASAAAQLAINPAQDDTFEKDAQLGDALAALVVDSMKDFTDANNQLVAGQNYQKTGDIKTYLSGGAFVSFPGVDKNAVIDVMNAFLLGNAVNELWRQQKIFIMGGGACGDNQGIGSGPQDFSVCRNGQAWYLYYWHEGNGDFLSAKQWGYVTMPPGADQLGQGDYAGVTVADVINSSLDSYNVAEYDYTAATAAARVQDALHNGWRNPGAQGPSWEGTFTIPVCDISAAIGQDWFDKQYILQPYDPNSRPVWCGPVCSNDWGKTSRFINAATMGGFKSPKHLCPGNIQY